MPHKIDSDKIFINKAFEWWYRVPDYQRPYVWGTDQVVDLLDDVTEWLLIRPESEYFLGSIVLQERQSHGITEFDLLDGQQRLSTCLMIYAVGRDLTTDPLLKKNCQQAIFQEEDPYKGIPERLRIVYDIRDDVREFVDRFIKPAGGTDDEEGLMEMTGAQDISVRNMAKAIWEIRDYFRQPEAPSIEDFFKFFGRKVLLVYVSSPDLDDAFRMFTVLNDRGMRLRGSDILKTSNLRAMHESKISGSEIRTWAQKWEAWEGDLGDRFDVFLSQLRAVLVKDKARLSLLQEFDDNIYSTKVFDKKTKTYVHRQPLLNRGRETFQFIDKYYEHYQQLFDGNNYHVANSWKFDNLITLLSETGLADFWQPPLLRYREVFGEKRILEFLIKLENKFCADWVTAQMPNDRIMAMNRITVEIDETNKKEDLTQDQKIAHILSSSVFAYDKIRFKQILDIGDIYSRRSARYLLFKLDVLLASHETRLQLPVNMSVEHILPQNPRNDSKWCKDFTDQERTVWTNRLGNLVLISRRKNSSQGRSDYPQKKEKYFMKNIETFPNSLRAMQYEQWDLPTLKKHHREAVNLLCA